MVQDLRHAQHRDDKKPEHHDRAKKAPDAGSAAPLHKEQSEQDHQGERNHVLLEGGRDYFHALHRRQHGNRRRDDAITIKQTGAKNTDQQQHLAQAWLVLDRLRGQRQHGHQSAFAVVVGAQHQGDVLDRDNDRQGPEENRQNAEHIGVGKWHVAGAEYLLDRIQYAGADVAINNADGAQSECSERRFGCCPAHS